MDECQVSRSLRDESWRRRDDNEWANFPLIKDANQYGLFRGRFDSLWLVKPLISHDS